MRPVNQVLQDIKLFQPDKDGWLKLEDLLAELWAATKPDRYIKQLFELLERFPVDESEGVLWGILHGLESFENYEPQLLESIQRQPTEITTYMVHRIANTGKSTIAGQHVSDVYRLIAEHSQAPSEARKFVQSYL